MIEPRAHACPPSAHSPRPTARQISQSGSPALCLAHDRQGAAFLPLVSFPSRRQFLKLHSNVLLIMRPTVWHYTLQRRKPGGGKETRREGPGVRNKGLRWPPAPPPTAQHGPLCVTPSSTLVQPALPSAGTNKVNHQEFGSRGWGWGWGAGGAQPLTPVLTRDSMILSFKASVSPCFIFTLFLSKHFMAYLRTP